jgi:hypothetical protein
MNQVISYAKKYAVPALVGALIALALDKRGHVPAFLKF